MKIICIGRNYAEHAKELNNPVPTGDPIVFMKPPFSPYISVPILSVLVMLPILGFARSGWEPWKIYVPCLMVLGTVAVFLAPSLRLAVVGRGMGGAIAHPSRSEPAPAAGRLVESPDLVAYEASEEDCTVWDCF